MSNHRWISVGAVTELKFSPGAVVEIEGRKLAIFERPDGSYRALDNECPHSSAPLGFGDVEGEVVICPLHGWEFELDTGQCLTVENEAVDCYPVRNLDGQLEVGLPVSTS